MSLHPEAKAALEELCRLGGAAETVAEARAARIRMAEGLEAEPVASVEEVGIPGPGGELKVRIYRPEDQPLGILVYFHGGGWVVGNLDTHDASCRALANATPCVVVAVDYRLAPEHKFPAAVEDAYAATVWAFENRAGLLDRGSRVAVGGDSAGGNLAAVVALMARDQGYPKVAYQLLIYPVTDYNLDTESYRAYGEGYFLTRQKMAWYWELYLRGEADGAHPYASVLRAPDVSGVAPALVITAEYDVLRDEGEAYARRLWDAGVTAMSLRYGGMIHGFFSLARTRTARRHAVAASAAGLRWAFTV